MVIKKVLNNNLLLVEEKGQEQIAMGRGLRFSYKVGDQVRKEDVEKVYMLKEEKTAGIISAWWRMRRLNMQRLFRMPSDWHRKGWKEN